MFSPQPTPSFEELKVGTELPTFHLRMSPPIMMRWCAAVEIWRRDHYDKDYAVNKVKQPDILGSGSWSKSFLYAYVSNWAGPNGWAWKQTQQNRAPMLPGDEYTIFGAVVSKEVKDGLGYVEIDLGMRTADGVT